MLATLVLAGCQNTQLPPPIAAAGPDAHTLYTRLIEAVKSCWFNGDAAFAAYNYTPEINANAPRILIVTKTDPRGRPVFVIEPKSERAADAYGPLLDGPAGARARADLDRWIRGSTSCA